MANPLVSVILAVKNGERFLAEAIESVIAQEYHPWELLVIDGHSTDGSVEIASSYARARVIPQQQTGIPDAWNTGIAHAQGELMAFLSSDDRWAPHKLARQVTHMLAHPKLMYTIANFRYFRQTDCPLPTGFNPALLGRNLVGRIMETLVARREVFDQVGQFNAAYTVSEDVDWYARAKDRNVSMAILDDVLLEKRLHDQNASSQAEVGTPLLLEILRTSIRRQNTKAKAA